MWFRFDFSSNSQNNIDAKIQKTKAEVDEVVDTLRINVQKLYERDQKLSELDNRADALQQNVCYNIVELKENQ